MTHKLAIDFGTTNTVITHWETDHAEVVSLPGLSTEPLPGQPAIIPSLLYLHDGRTSRATVGQVVRGNGLDVQKDNRLFRNFKRGIVASPVPAPRDIDGALWAERDAGRLFIRQMLQSLPYTDIEQLVLTAPVVSFEGYLSWLNEAVGDTISENTRIVDESTAAALGYAVTEPGAVVLVFDFGGGTLDLSLVQLPESREKTGGFLRRLLKGNSHGHTARVIAKAGRVIGGSDIDQWLLAEALRRTGLSVNDLANDYAALLTRCEQAKIALSTVESADLTFDAAGKTHNIIMTRQELESLLEQNGFFAALRHMVDKVMHIGHQRGIFKEDIRYVLMVGGTSLMPSVQRLLGRYFSEMAVRADKPFTAIAEGALQVAAGLGLEDYLVHSYGIRHLDLQTHTHHYDEIIPMGSRYPTQKPIEVVLGAAHDQQKAIEFIIGEIDTESANMLEVKYENGQAVFVAQGDSSGQQIIPLNRSADTLAPLVPPGVSGEDRIRAYFSIDESRQLRLTVRDLKLDEIVLDDAIVATIR